MTHEELLQEIEKAKASGATKLNLSWQGLTDLPAELFELKNLTALYLANNWLTSLPPEIGQLKNLTKLNITGNKLASLPSKIGQLPKLERLYLDGNPLTSPPIEIIKKGIEAIRNYFAALQEDEQPLNQVKLLLVGEGAAGKTSLVKQLLSEEFNIREDTTHGINIRNWQVKEHEDTALRVNIWDFGGQEIMHATHQFFLSKRSLYILVLDGRRDERPEYWLRHIESFGGDSPVLVVLNKQDSNPSYDVNRPFLMRKYPAVKGFFRTSCADGHGIARFRKTLLKELAQVEMISIRWPGSWFRVKERIEQLDQACISSEEYSEICGTAGISEPQSREVLVDFLHDLGAAVHFRDFALKATHVLDPIWVTEAVYRIINAKQVADDRGALRLDSLEGILPCRSGEKLSWPAITHVFILELMKKFELCWGISTEEVLIPQLLPVAEPDFTFNDASALGFVLHYQDFLPPSVMPRFLVRQHGQIKSGLCWRTGAVLEDAESGTEAVVKADHEARKICLWVNGPRRKEYLSFLWFSLRAINQSFEKLAVSERIPMPDDHDVTADYQTLLDNVKDGIERYRPDGAQRAYNVHELLGLVEPSKEEKKSVVEMLNSVVEIKAMPPFIDINISELFNILLDKQKRK